MLVTKAGAPVALTKKEFDLLLLFARNQNMALFRESIYERVWEAEYNGDSRTVDLHVQRLRKKLGWQNQLTAVYKVGYRLEASPWVHWPPRRQAVWRAPFWSSWRATA